MPPPLQYTLRYGGRAEVCLRDALDAAGWVEVEEGAPLPGRALIFVPYTRVPWPEVLAPGSARLCACHPIRTALVRKDALLQLTQRLPAGSAPQALLLLPGAAPAALAALPPPPWVLKAPALNNALGVRICASAQAVEEACSELWGAAGAPLPLVLQECLGACPTRPLRLHQGAKFHCRANVLAVGCCAVYLHEAVVCHVACEPLAGAGAASRHALITNHVLQRQHPSYRRAAHTLLLQQVLGEEGGGCTLLKLEGLLAALFSLALEGKRLTFPPLPVAPQPAPAPAPAAAAAPPPFLPAPNCFELFGVDVLLLEDGSPVLLEVNGGPALEGMALPALCAQLCKDTVELVLGHLRPGDGVGGGGAGEGADEGVAWKVAPVPKAGNGWKRIL